MVPPMPALPPQLLPNPGLDDPAAWSAANGWSIDGEGAAKTGTTYARLTALNVSLGDGTDYVMAFRVIEQTSSTSGGGSLGARMASGNINSNIKYLGWLDPVHTELQVSHVRNRTPSQLTVQFDAANTWQGRIADPALYDVSAERHKPTLILASGGQSNEEDYGDGQTNPYVHIFHPGIWMCPPVNYVLYGAIANTVTVAQCPLVSNSTPSRRPGKAMAMARRIVSLTGGAVRVVIVPAAKTGVGMLGTGVSGGWNPDTTMTGEANRYATLLTAHAAAKSQIENYIGTIMCWSGNEADMQVANGAALLPAAFRNFVTRVRADMDEDIPIIISGPVPSNQPTLRAVQSTFDEGSGHANAIPGVTYFDGPEGSEWHNVADPVHWTMEGIRVTGDYAGQIAYGIGQERRWW